MRVDVQKILSPEPANSYSLVVQWGTVRLVFIFQCILGLQSQSIEFTNSSSQEYIISGYPVFIVLTRYLKSYGGKFDVILRLNKILYG